MLKTIKRIIKENVLTYEFWDKMRPATYLLIAGVVTSFKNVAKVVDISDVYSVLAFFLIWRIYDIVMEDRYDFEIEDESGDTDEL